MTDAEIVAYNSAAALAFHDEAAAKVQLSALTAKSDLVAALLYRSDGRIFARYYRGGIPTAELPRPVEGKLSRVNGQNIEMFARLGGVIETPEPRLPTDSGPGTDDAPVRAEDVLTMLAQSVDGVSLAPSNVATTT